jgi:hypothetical protein
MARVPLAPAAAIKIAKRWDRVDVFAVEGAITGIPQDANRIPAATTQ